MSYSQRCYTDPFLQFLIAAFLPTRDAGVDCEGYEIRLPPTGGRRAIFEALQSTARLHPSGDSHSRASAHLRCLAFSLGSYAHRSGQGFYRGGADSPCRDRNLPLELLNSLRRPRSPSKSVPYLSETSQRSSLPRVDASVRHILQA